MRLRRASFAVLPALAMVAAVVSPSSRAATPPAELVSRDTGLPALMATDGSISGDGGVAVFSFSTGDPIENIFRGMRGFVRNRAAGTTATTPMLSQQLPDVASPQIVVSRDGCHVAYISTGRQTQLIATNRCIADSEHVLASTSLGISMAYVAISSHGRYVAVQQNNDGLVTVLRVDRDSDQDGVLDDTTPVLATTTVPAYQPALGDETLTGRVAVAADVDGTYQIWLWDPTRSPNDPAAMQLVSAADNSTSTRANQYAAAPSMTPDGRLVTFTSAATNLTVGNIGQGTQIYVRDVSGSRTRLVSKANGVGGNSSADTSSISADGTQVAFSTTATNLLPPGGGGALDTPVRDLDLLVATSTSGLFDSVTLDRVALTPTGGAFTPIRHQAYPIISSNGRWVIFESAHNAELTTGGSSATPSADLTQHVYVIQRPTALSITPLTFPATQVGSTSAPLTATVTNTGLSSVLPATLTTTGDFAVVGGTCAVGAWISPGRSCTLDVRFAPTAAGNRAGSVRVAENGFAPVSQDGRLSGVGSTITVTTPTTPPTTAPRQPALAISPSAADFGAQRIFAASEPRSFTVTNTGSGPTAALTTTLTGGQAAEFALEANTCAGATLAPGATCTVAATYTPSGTAAASTTLRVAAGGLSVTATLRGRGAAPSLAITPNPADFGQTTVGVPTPALGFTITNTGSAADTIATVGIGGDHAADYAIAVNSCEGVEVPAGGTCNVSIVFTPSAAGTRTAFVAAFTTLVDATADLTGVGTFTPTLRMVPEVVALGESTIAVGAGFPPGLDVQLRWEGIDQVFTGTVSPTGDLQVRVLLRLDDDLGPRTMVVEQPAELTGITAPALVVQGSASPPVDNNPALPGAFSFVVRH